jgi:hypothetical protein
MLLPRAEHRPPIEQTNERIPTMHDLAALGTAIIGLDAIRADQETDARPRRRGKRAVARPHRPPVRHLAWGALRALVARVARSAPART